MPTAIEQELEVVNYAPPLRSRTSKYGSIHLQLLQMLLKIPLGKSIRRGHADREEAHSFAGSLRSYLKKQKLSGTYFVSEPAIAEGDGRFYVYIGRREGE